MAKRMDINHLKKDIEFKYYNEFKSIKQIANELNVSHTLIHRNMKEWGFEIRQKKKIKGKYDIYKDEIYKKYFIEKKSILEISTEMNLNESTLYQSFDRWEWTKRNFKEMNTKFYIDDKYFEEIDSEEKAYWLGFMYADGYITKNDDVAITLSSIDISHLEKFQRSLNTNFEIKTYKNKSSNNFSGIDNSYSRIKFKSEKIANDLIKLGCFKNKSLILKFPTENQLPKIYQKDFIRGYFDGDGSFVKTKNNHYSFSICGTKEFLEKINEILNKEIIDYENSFKSPLHQRVKSDKNTFILKYGGRLKTLAFMNWLYENSNIYLDRKYQKYIKQLNIVEPNGNIGC